MATIKTLVAQNCIVHVVLWDKNNLTPYKNPEYKNVFTYSRSEQTYDTLKKLVKEIKPDIAVVSGWQDLVYLRIASLLRKNRCPVITGLDGQWYGSIKQYIAVFLGLCGFFDIFYSHAWVAGPYQYEYARSLGFRKEKIIFDLLSADIVLFQSSYNICLDAKKDNYPHRFLFVGRFEDIKGLDTLLDAWEMMLKERCDWELHFIGNGSYKKKLLTIPDIVVKEFMQPDELVKEIAGAGCFVLPSRAEPWGVVVHEFAAAGLPLIISDKVGASATFLIPGMNGYSFKANDATSLAKSMLCFIKADDNELLEMSKASNLLSNRITPYTSASNLLSLVK